MNKMKDSGISWIGEVPESWDIKRISYLTTSRSGGTPDRDNRDFWYDGNIPWMSSGEVNKVKVFDTYEKITSKAIQNSSATIIPKNSVMVALNGQGKTKGMCAILKIDAACNQSLCAFTCFQNELNYSYLFYCFQSMYSYLRNMSGDSARDGLSTTFVKTRKISVPSLTEQQSIATFLDDKCLKIDNIISDLEKEIQILEKYKKSLITETVTKGLDKNVLMKDSGVDWIGEIPEHWSSLPLKRATSILTCGVASTPEYVDENQGVLFLSAQNIQNGAIDFTKKKYITHSLHNELTKNRKVINGDILQVRVGATIGKCAIVNINTDISIYVSLTHIRANNRSLPPFLKYILESELFISSATIDVDYAGSQGNLNVADLKEVKIPVTILDEQQQIVDFLDKKCEEINSTISTKEKQLEIIKKYKQSLIYEYVTGKKRVAGFGGERDGN